MAGLSEATSKGVQDEPPKEAGSTEQASGSVSKPSNRKASIAKLNAKPKADLPSSAIVESTPETTVQEEPLKQAGLTEQASGSATELPSSTTVESPPETTVQDEPPKEAGSTEQASGSVSKPSNRRASIAKLKAKPKAELPSSTAVGTTVQDKPPEETGSTKQVPADNPIRGKGLLEPPAREEDQTTPVPTQEKSVAFLDTQEPAPPEPGGGGGAAQDQKPASRRRAIPKSSKVTTKPETQTPKEPETKSPSQPVTSARIQITVRLDEPIGGNFHIDGFVNTVYKGGQLEKIGHIKPGDRVVEAGGTTLGTSDRTRDQLKSIIKENKSKGETSLHLTFEQVKTPAEAEI